MSDTIHPSRRGFSGNVAAVTGHWLVAPSPSCNDDAREGYSCNRGLHVSRKAGWSSRRAAADVAMDRMHESRSVKAFPGKDHRGRVPTPPPPPQAACFPRVEKGL
jgi:hypothetical protein